MLQIIDLENTGYTKTQRKEEEDDAPMFVETAQSLKISSSQRESFIQQFKQGKKVVIQKKKTVLQEIKWKTIKEPRN